MEFITRFLHNPKQSFFLFGPRGTGKSLWTKHFYKDALKLDLLDPETFRIYSGRPEKLTELVHGNPHQKEIIIDEVQKIPILLSAVHQLIEEDPKRQFILTGSSSRKIKRSGADLLAGRALLCHLHPFMASELGEKFDFAFALTQGLLPLVWAAKEPGEVLRAYQALYMREEVQMEGLVRNIGNFNRFLEGISFSHAAVLNLSNVARECEVEQKTAQAYIEILEDLLLSFRVPVFTKRAQRQVIAHPKFYYFDAGVFRAIRPKGPLDRVEEIDGAALEGLVVQHLRAWKDYRGKKNELYFWRTRGGAEVDAVLYGEDGLWAFEIKNAGKIYPKDVRSLGAFKEEYPESKTFLLYRGKERLKIKETLCFPVEEFLKQLAPNQPLFPQEL